MLARPPQSPLGTGLHRAVLRGVQFPRCLIVDAALREVCRATGLAANDSGSIGLERQLRDQDSSQHARHPLAPSLAGSTIVASRSGAAHNRELPDFPVPTGPRLRVLKKPAVIAIPPWLAERLSSLP